MFLKETVNRPVQACVVDDRRFLAEARHVFLIRRPDEIAASWFALIHETASSCTAERREAPTSSVRLRPSCGPRPASDDLESNRDSKSVTQVLQISWVAAHDDVVASRRSNDKGGTDHIRRARSSTRSAGRSSTSESPAGDLGRTAARRRAGPRGVWQSAICPAGPPGIDDHRGRPRPQVVR